VRISTVQATPNLLDVWRITPRIGRTFTADEVRAGGERVAVVSDAFWQRQLSATPDAIGTTLLLDGEAHTIIGVLRSNAATGIFRTADVFTPIPARRATHVDPCWP
jgi:hypothetical protein